MQRDAARTRSARHEGRRSGLRLTIGLSIALAFGGLSGCNHVPLEPAAEEVRVIDQAEAGGCEQVGSTKVKVLAKVVGFKRGEDKMSNELTTLARNAAVDMQGNAVASDGAISDGSQKFSIYRCP